MVSKKNTEKSRVAPQKAIEFLSAQYEQGAALLSKNSLSSDEHSKWELLTGNLLGKAFGDNSPNVSAILNVGKYGSFPMNAGEGWWSNHRVQSLRTQLTKLEGLIELLQTEIDLENEGVIQQDELPHGKKIFLVHGHDEAALHGTARYLEKIEQEVIVLREQPNRGRTIIEKFEDYADVGFAVVLLTADDRGGTKEKMSDEQSPRARQNVIFEFGYFIGRLGRNRVCALHSPNVEIPSDYDGVVYIELDSAGAWQLQLAKEIRAAGLEVDMNLAL